MVTAEDKLPFNRRFASESQVKNSVYASLEENTADIQNARATMQAFKDSLTEGGKISNGIKRTAEDNLIMMFRTVACLQLRRWAPDVLSNDPESFYNLLHEHIALKTFEQVVGATGYSHTGMNQSDVRNFPLMRKMYRSFVFSYMHGIAKAEAKSPGSVEKSNKLANVYKRRMEVCITLMS